MPVDWSIGLRYLQQAGEDADRQMRQREFAQKEAERQRSLQTRQSAAQQLGRGDYKGAMATAVQSGDLDVVKSISGLQEHDQKRLAGEAKILAAVGTRLRTLPMEQRGPALQQFAPMLRQYGFDDDEFAGADLSDAGVDNYIAMGKAFLDKTPSQDEPSVIRALDAIGLDRRSPEYAEIVKRSVAPPRFLPNGDSTYTVVGGYGGGSASPPTVPSSGPPAAAVDHLRANPNLAAQFDAKFGPGASGRYLQGGAAPQASGPFGTR